MLPNTCSRYVRSGADPDERCEVEAVERIVDQLLDHVASSRDAINAAHVHGAQSKQLQDIFEELLRERLGFRSEVVLTPQDGFVTQARADCVFELAPGRGVIAEVERGGAVNNNHDLKDLWKTHVAADLQHLILLVPMTNWKSDGNPRERPFKRVSNRLGAFFGDPRREIDVLSCHVIGYGD